jgi:hypothetical protein
MSAGIVFVLRVATRNLANYQRGTGRRQMMARVREAKKHRNDAWVMTRTSMMMAKVTPAALVPCVVTLRRMSSHWRGLDRHDGLPGALKNVVDGIADALGIDDGGPMVEWRYENKRCARGNFGVEVQIERRT